jgi:hypothetical protein
VSCEQAIVAALVLQGGDGQIYVVESGLICF